MADQTLRFDIIGDDKVSGPFSRAGASAGELSRKMDIAAKSALVLDEALKRQRTASRTSVDATLALARADKILEEAEHGLRDGALEAEFALKKQTEAAKKSGDAAEKAAGQNRGLAASLARVADSARKGGGPAWLGPALALIPAAGTLGGVAAGAAAGIAGGVVAGAAALAAFGAVAKPVLASALTASQAVNTAQDNYNAAIAGGTKQAVAYKAEQIAIAKAYAELSPQQIALSKQLGNMAGAWQSLKAAQTPVVAGALQPWLRSVTDLTGNLAPIIAKVSPVIRDLGIQFDGLINSPAFRGFRDFVAGTGSAAVGAAGSTVIDLVKSFIILLPQFNPLISKAVGWIGGLGPAVLKWAQSKKASDDITRFMAWFSKNGPVVGGLLKNIGGALKALAPGLTSGGMTELSLLSTFFGFVAKLPPGLARPLAEVAGALLIMNKLGVVSVGVKILGSGGGGGAAEAEAGAGAGAGLWSRLLPGVRLVGGALVISAIIDMALKNTSSGTGKNWLDNPFGQGTFKDPKTGKQAGTPTWLTSFPTAFKGSIVGEISANWTKFGHGIEASWNTAWRNMITRTAAGFHDIAGWFNWGRRFMSGSFGQNRREVAHIWDLTWNNTIGRVQRGFHDIAGWFDTGRHWVAARWDGMGRDLLSGWNWIIRNVFDPLRDFVTKTVPGWFGTAVHGVSVFWDGLKNAVRGPVAFVVDKVLDGLISVFDTITGAVGLGSLHISQVHPMGLAAGGRIPGFGGGDRWPALLEGGEAVVDKRTTAAHAADLRAWGVPGFAAGGKIGQNPPGIHPGTTGQPGGGPGFLGRIIDAGKMALAFATGNSAAFTAAFAGLLGRGTGGAGGIMAKILTQIPKVIAGDLVKWIMGKSAAQGSGGAIADYAMTFLGKIPYVWGGTSVPGGADCSGFTQAIYRHFGISAPRTSEAQGAWVRRSGPQPGGLAFYHSPAGGPDPGHVAIVRSALQVISQGGGMGPTLIPLHALPLLWTGVPPGGLSGGGPGGAAGGTMSAGAIASLWTSAGGPASAAANMARIAFAESGDRPGAIQQGQPPGLTGWGLYQITPTSGITQNGAFGNLLNAANNTRAAISLFSQSGYGPWASDPVGRQLAAAPFGFDTGYGILPPGLSLSWNGTGHPEMLQPARGGGRGGGVTYIINVHPSPLARPADIGREVVGAIKAYEHGSGKGWRS